VQNRNFTAIDKYYAADVVDHSAFPNQAPGREGLKAAMKELFDAYPRRKGESAGYYFGRRARSVATEEWSKGWEWLD